ncbi:MAG TPA: DUF4080 domain-containing protein [Clostridiales bacterium]|nr:DUF4080 domain-containing protein [Clostridiales bacterium]
MEKIMTKKTQVVIATLNSKYIHSALAPWCLLAGIRQYCQCTMVSASVIEGTINEPVENVAQRIIDHKPQVLGLCCYIWNITKIHKLIAIIKQALPNTVIAVGGPEVSYNAKAVLSKNIMIDYVLSGEGELPFAQLVDAVNGIGEISQVGGICYRNDSDIVVSPPYVSNYDPPTPYCEDYFKSLNGRITYLEGSRGCPYSCAFCLSGRCGNVRYYDIERTKRELLLLCNSGTQTVKFVDRTFNGNKKRAKELYQFIIDNYGGNIPEGVCIHFEIAGDILDSESLDILSRVPRGAIQLEIGLQSFNPYTLDAINRKTNVDKLTKNIKALVAMGNMHIHIDLIAGLPLEDLQSFENSFNTAYGLQPNMLQLGFLKVLYGSAIGENPPQYGCSYSIIPPYEVTKTAWLTHNDLVLLQNTEDALERLYNSGRFRKTLEYLLTATKEAPFMLFSQFGKYAARQGTVRVSLNDYTAFVYHYFSNKVGIDKAVLRDAMVWDRLSTNASGKLPQVLQIKDDKYRQIKQYLQNGSTTKQGRGVKRGIAILYSKPVAIYVDYISKNPITGEYKVNAVSLEVIE